MHEGEERAQEIGYFNPSLEKFFVQRTSRESSFVSSRSACHPASFRNVCRRMRELIRVPYFSRLQRLPNINRQKWWEGSSFRRIRTSYSPIRFNCGARKFAVFFRWFIAIVRFSITDLHRKHTWQIKTKKKFFSRSFSLNISGSRLVEELFALDESSSLRRAAWRWTVEMFKRVLVTSVVTQNDACPKCVYTVRDEKIRTEVISLIRGR